VSHKELKIMI